MSDDAYADRSQAEQERVDEKIRTAAQSVRVLPDAFLQIVDCIECEEPITEKRKMAFPHAIRCTGCQVEFEKFTKGR
ncbi:MAG: TraR/DksA C4-type zinc finger protein [Burkholderiaceae bacterium]